MDEVVWGKPVYMVGVGKACLWWGKATGGKQLSSGESGSSIGLIPIIYDSVTRYLSNMKHSHSNPYPVVLSP